MIVSTRGRYALRVMIDIAEHPNEPYIPLKSIAAIFLRACAARAAAIV